MGLKTIWSHDTLSTLKRTWTELEALFGQIKYLRTSSRNKKVIYLFIYFCFRTTTRRLKATTVKNTWKSSKCGRLKWCPKTSLPSKITTATKECPKKCEPVTFFFTPKYTFWPGSFLKPPPLHLEEIMFWSRRITNKRKKQKPISSYGYPIINQENSQILRKSAKMCFFVVKKFLRRTLF